MMKAHRKHKLYLAHLLHRLSGLSLVIFLPFHFALLSSALRGEAELDSRLAIADNLLFKIAEYGLVFLLCVHLLGGIRLLVLEWVAPSSDRWTDVHKSLALIVVVIAFCISTIFFWRAIA